MKSNPTSSLGWLAGILFILFSLPAALPGQVREMKPARQKISIDWGIGKPTGTVTVINGRLGKIAIIRGKGKVKGNRFEFSSTGDARIAVEIDSVHNQPGPEPTLISIKTNDHSFSFFLRDVSDSYPIYIPDYSVVVLLDSDNRSFAEVQSDVLSRKLRTKLQKLASEPEESFGSAARRTMDQSVPTWLGISRDFRLFQITESMPDDPLGGNIIVPYNSSTSLHLSGPDQSQVYYSYTLGRGISVEVNNHRRLEDGILPILHSTHIDEDIMYHSTCFVSLEKSPLTGLKGTDFLVADKYSIGNMFTAEQEESLKTRLKDAFNTTEETVLFYRCEITNTDKVPRYAWFRTLRAGGGHPRSFDPDTGLSAYSSDSIYCISKLNGKPLPNEEVSILIKPGEKVVFEFYLPHAPVTMERALALSSLSFEGKLGECKAFWQNKLKKAAQIHVPEKRIEEMIQAGLLHLDLITYGNEPDGTLAPTIGVYSPIGTESSPIIQFYNSIGWPDVAKRSLTYFLDKQHADGFMQNFGGYMVETGAALWSFGEYFRYTDDRQWIKQIEPKLLKSCDFLLEWRNRNKVDSLRGAGYGMIAGKVADPEDPFHQFMLNGYACLGISRVAEILAAVDPDQSSRLGKEAEAWKNDIRESFFNEMAQSPVVPLGDGTWCPTASPWTEAVGPRALYFKSETYYSHGTFMVPDELLGPMYLVFCEVLGVHEPASKMLLDYHSELFFQSNTVFSQPYYCRHNWVQAKLGMVGPFLKTYYNTFSALADRETYTFWEHLHHASVHKTHEEAWFLMETRWMLYLEDGQTLKLMNTIPRKWMANGETIELSGVQSYFGTLNVKVKSSVDQGFIEATIECNSNRKPGMVTIRLPHPDGKKAIKVTGGEYNPETETVTVQSFSGKAYVRVEF